MANKENSQLDLPSLPLPEGISSKYIVVNDLLVQFLDAQPKSETSPRGTNSKPPLIVLVHGFPELAYSWRKLMRSLSDLGFRVVAADQRGFGRTVPLPTGSSVTSNYPYTYDGPLAPFSPANLARDTVAFVYALGYEKVASIMGHDSGSIAASSSALVRPDIFHSLVLMSAPFTGAPDLPFGVPTYPSLPDALAADKEKTPHMGLAVDAMLTKLNPPLMYYQHYYSLPQANVQMHTELSPKQLHDFFRAYFHIKSACWPDPTSPSPSEARFNTPCRLESLEEIAFLPPYYMMPRGQSMPAVVGAHHPRDEALEHSRAWQSDDDISVYASEYGRTGFQGGLNRYRCATRLGRIGDTLESISASNEDHITELTLFTRKKIEVPALFVAGEKDWGPFQYPGAFEKMRAICPMMKEGEEGIVFIKNAGHWVQQENPDDLFAVLKAFLENVPIRA